MEGINQTAMMTIEELRRKFDVPDAVFEGTKAANGWKGGKQVEEQDFRDACEAFRKAPTDGRREDKEAKG